ncbi:MAG: D-alanine--D-alanine ligase family protein [Candidatus Methylomirabilis sp.]
MRRIGLLFGSRSVEREVSVMTASKVYEVLQRLQDRFETLPIFLAADGSWLLGESVRDLLSVDAELRRLAERSARAGPAERARIDAEKLRLNKERYTPQLGNLDRGPRATGVEPLFLAPDPSVRSLVPRPERRGWLRRQLHPRLDVAFPVIHGTHGEDGTIQGLCELADLPYVGAGVVASAVGMDKILSKLAFRGAGLPTVEGIAFTRRQLLEDEAAVVKAVEARLGYPVVVKPAVAGSSIGIGMAQGAQEILQALRRAIRFSQRVLVERAVEKRLEVQCSVLGNHTLTVSECEELIRTGPIVSYQEKYSEDKKPGTADLAPSVIPARIPRALSEEVRRLAIEAFRAIDSRGISRVDFLIDSTTMNPFVNEINTMPGSLSFALWEASGVKPTELVGRLMELALEAHQEKSLTQFESKEGRALVDRRHLVMPGK